MKATIFHFAVTPIAGGKDLEFFFLNYDKALDKLMGYYKDDDYEILTGLRPAIIEDFDDIFNDEGKGNIEEQNPDNKVVVFRK